MAEIKVIPGLAARRQKLDRVLGQMRSRLQGQFANPLKVCEHLTAEAGGMDGDTYSVCYHLQMVEVVETCWLKYFKTKRWRRLLLIDIDHLGSERAPKRLECFVYDGKLLEIVKEEIGRYADDIGAAGVDVHTEYAG